MKRLFITSGLAAACLLFALPSCKKDTGNTCICKVNGDEVGRYDLGKQKRSDAVAACEEKAVTFGIIAECYLD